MSAATDPYLEWNAAYVLGSLPPSERREYEQHVAECQTCARAVASLAGMAGILATVPSDSAFALLDDTAASPGPAEKPSLLPKLLRAAQRQRRRARVRVAVLVTAVAVVVAAITLVLPSLITKEAPVSPPNRFAMTQTIPSPITADAALIRESWGTRIEGTCRYERPATGPGKPWDYAMYITTKDGASTEIASWTAEPGSEMSFTATTRVPVDQISSIDIRLVGKDLVLLQTTFTQ